MTRSAGDESGDGLVARARDQALSALLYLGQRLSSSGTGGERRSDRGPSLSPGDEEALFRAIENEVIPRLMLAHQSEPDVSATPPVEAGRAVLTRADHDHFLEVLMHDSEASLRVVVHALLERGISRESIFIDLMGGAARRLGELWEQDECDFTDVTIGLCRLHSVLREESGSFVRDVESRDAPDADIPRILLATGSGDQHIFGVVLVAEFFRRTGWQVWSEPGAQMNHLAGLLAHRDFDAVGLSVSCSTLVDDVKCEVEAFRKASRNKRIKVLVGGRLFVEAPELVARVGADGTSSDARSAPIVANRLIGRSEMRI